MIVHEKLILYFSEPQVRHMQGFIIAMMIYGYHGKQSNVSDMALNASRSSVCRFLNSKSWEEKYLLREMQQEGIRQIWKKSKETGLPIYVIIDDTICEKTVPSQRSLNQ